MSPPLPTYRTPHTAHRTPRLATTLGMQHNTIDMIHRSVLAAIRRDTEIRGNLHRAVLLNTCETDPQFPAEKQAKADEVLGGGKFAPGYERKYWPGVVHGFSVRGDLSNPQVKAAKEGAFKDGVEWLIKYL
ncbi:hypothetical protein EVG20_g9875 [Dentipellis fragilis]|uniref:Dienelactone hydrolase domain-containing protein n=1 Tax=Dentipellis fragilis TaxID=205917 RepID=A0A4Y9XV47_9AGAM|nr:hypothetical protein EVG20_g9875 [Dentipellis fragilis]